MNKIRNFISDINVNPKKYWLFFGLFFVLACFIFSINVTVNPAGLWDESIYAISAKEMINSGNYWVNTWGGITDYSNTKPVLAFWPLVASFKMFGCNTFAIRFPTILFSLILFTVVGIYIKKRYSNVTSLIAMAAWLTSIQVIISHGFRSGDVEGLYLLFFVSCMLCLLESKHRSWTYLLVALFASLAFLTKGLHALLIPIIVLIYYIMTRDYKKLKWWIYPSIIIIYLLPIFGWAACRYQYDGFAFFQNMFSDFATRTTSDIGTQSKLFVIGPIIANPSFDIIVILGIIILIKKTKEIGFKKVVSNVGHSFTYDNYEKHHDILLCAIVIILFLIIFLIPRTAFGHYTYAASLMNALLLVFILYSPYSLNTINSKRHINIFTSSVLSASILSVIIYCSIPIKLSGIPLLLHRYHEIYPNTNEVFYMENKCAKGNNEPSGKYSWNRNHDGLYLIIVEYNWSYRVDGGIDEFKIDPKGIIILDNKRAKIYDLTPILLVPNCDWGLYK